MKKLNSVRNLHYMDPNIHSVSFFARRETLACEYVQVSRMLAEVR